MVFGLPGVHALALWNAVEKAGMRYVGFRHEQAAAHAADGYGRAAGRPGVVLLSTGPGALNALSAIGEAFVSSSPVLAITSAIPSQFFRKARGVLHESKDLQPAFSSVTRFAAAAADADSIPGLLDEAIAAATHLRPGPSLLEIPSDLLDAEVEAAPRKSPRPSPAVERDVVDEAAQILSLAARPIIWAGGGVNRARAWEEVRQVAELVQAPVLTTFMGKGAFPESHPLSVGTVVRLPAAIPLLQESDAMLAVGTRFSGMSTGNWRLPIPAQLVHLDIDAEEIGKNYPVRVGMVAGAKEGLAALGQALARKLEGREREDGSQRAAIVRAAARESGMAEGPREMEILEAVRRAVDPEIPIVHDMTVPSYWAWPFLEASSPGTVHSPYGFGSLGFSFPAAIGVASANPDRPVVSFCGDGGFQYHARELATVAQYRIPVVVVVFNDRAWGVLKSFSTARYGTTFGMDLPGPDFVALAQSYGVATARAQEPEELEKALVGALSSVEPALIEMAGPWQLPPPSEYYRR